MKRLKHIPLPRYLSLALLAMLIVLLPANVAVGQSSVTATERVGLLQLLPAITFLIAMVTGFLNLYTMNKQAAIKEEILNIVRSEFDKRVDVLERRLATKEYVDAFRREVQLMLKNIEIKVSKVSRDSTDKNSRL